MPLYTYAPDTTFYPFVRFSTKKQADGDSYRRQIDAAESFGIQESVPLDRSLHEIDIRSLGMSALSGKHIIKGPIRKFLAGVEDGTVKPGRSVLLVGEWNRLTRQVSSDALEFVIALMKAGIGIIDLQDRAYYTLARYNDDLGLQISLQVKISMAHQYSKNLRHTVSAACASHRQQIFAGKGKPTNACPLWLIVDEATGEYIERESRFAIVTRIFEMTADGKGKRLIARILNEQGVPPFKGGGNGWHHSSVERILNNPAARGIYQGYLADGTPVGEPQTGYYPVVIKEDLYLRAMAARARNRGEDKDGKTTGLHAGEKGTFKNLLSGHVHCTVCGAGLVYENKGGERGAYLVCSKARRGLCDKKYPHPYEPLEADLFQVLSVVDYSRLLDRPPTQSDETVSIEALIAEKNTKITALVAMPVIVPKVIQEITKLQGEVDALTAQVASQRQAAALAEIVAKQDNHSQFKQMVEKGGVENRGRVYAELCRIIHSGEATGNEIVLRLTPSTYWQIEFHFSRSRLTSMLLRNLNGDGSESAGYYPLPGDAWIEPITKTSYRIPRSVLFDPDFIEQWAEFAG